MYILHSWKCLPGENFHLFHHLLSWAKFPSPQIFLYYANDYMESMVGDLYRIGENYFCNIKAAGLGKFFFCPVKIFSYNMVFVGYNICIYMYVYIRTCEVMFLYWWSASRALLRTALLLLSIPMRSSSSRSHCGIVHNYRRLHHCDIMTSMYVRKCLLLLHA